MVPCNRRLHPFLDLLAVSYTDIEIPSDSVNVEMGRHTGAVGARETRHTVSHL